MNCEECLVWKRQNDQLHWTIEELDRGLIQERAQLAAEKAKVEKLREALEEIEFINQYGERNDWNLRNKMEDVAMKALAETKTQVGDETW